MGLEMILILAASAAAIAAVGAVVYRRTPNRATSAKLEVEKSPAIEKPVEIQTAPEPELVSEAPPPFSEDSSISKGIATPSDTTAINAAAPFVSIQLPKNAQRAATRVRRKRKAPRARTLPQSINSTVIPSLDIPDKKEPSAA